jgi:flagellar hook-basal body complex protein FliE
MIMSEIDTSQLITQMRAMASAAQGSPSIQPPAAGGSDFSALLMKSLDSVNSVQKQAGKLSTAFVMGDSSVSLAEVMVAKQKSGIAFEATLQVRNKLVGAYKEIMAMQV